jgi:hypothetical protein
MPGRQRALIVANDEYEHEGLTRLRSPSADAEALAKVLGDRRISEFDVEVVHNETAHTVQARIEDLFAESTREDILLLHLSCHGLKNDSGELFFAARNTRPDRLGSTAVSADFVQKCMRASRSRSIVLLLDCCYGGAFRQGVSVRATGNVNVLDSFPAPGTTGRGRAVITASNSMEYAFDGDLLADDRGAQPSVFTAALVEGLSTGEADRDEDGWIALGELYDYVFDKVRARNPNQTPTRDLQLQGELYLARSNRKRIRSVPIPPDLLAATTDPNMYTRLGAVAELRARLSNDDAAVALGAYETLRTMAQADTRTVADAAAAALAAAAVKPAETAWHLGQVLAGSTQRHTIALLGPSLALASVSTTADSWITASIGADGLEITVDTTVPGERTGRVSISGPTGELTVPVTVTVLERPRRIVVPEPARSPEPRAQEWSAPRLEPKNHSIAAVFAICAALLLGASIVPDYTTSGSLYSERLFAIPYVIGVALGLVIAALLTLVRSTLDRSSSAGMMLGLVATSTWGWVLLVSDLSEADTNSGSAGFGWTAAQRVATFEPSTAYWLLLIGHVFILAAGGYALTVPTSGGPTLGKSRIPIAGWTVLLGALGAATMIANGLDLFGVRDIWYARLWPPTLVVAAVAVIVPLCALLRRPSRFIAALLMSWAFGAMTIVLSTYVYIERTPDTTVTMTVLFGVSIAMIGITWLVHRSSSGRSAVA